MWDYPFRLGPYKQAPQLRADKLQWRICIIGEIENTVLSNRDNAVRLILQQKTNDTSFFLYTMLYRVMNAGPITLCMVGLTLK